MEILGLPVGYFLGGIAIIAIIIYGFILDGKNKKGGSGSDSSGSSRKSSSSAPAPAPTPTTTETKEASSK